MVQLVRPLISVEGPLLLRSYMDGFPYPPALSVVAVGGQYRGTVPVDHVITLGSMVRKG